MTGKNPRRFHTRDCPICLINAMLQIMHVVFAKCSALFMTRVRTWVLFLINQVCFVANRFGPGASWGPGASPDPFPGQPGPGTEPGLASQTS